MAHEKLVEEELSVLKSRDFVEAIAIVGSYARDQEAEHNDIDFFIVVDEDWRKRETEKVDDVVVERFYNSKEGIKAYLRQDDWWKTFHWLKNADIRYDPENIFEDLRDYAEDRKEEALNLTEEEEDEILYSIWDRYHDLESDDVGRQRFLMNDFVDYLVLQDFRLKGVVPVKRNYRLEKLKGFDGYMYKLVQDFLMSSSTVEKKDRMDKMVEYVTRCLGEVGPEWSTGKEDFP
ncbi:MAG: nucleotidyltransferase domain-containing protein [Candidatus Nanohalobium sp.]